MATSQLPEWEGSPPKPGFKFFNKEKLFSASQSTPKEPLSEAAAPKPSLSDRFNRLLPPNRTYFGRSRKTVLLSLLGLVLLILALAIGLGVGLKHKSSDSDLPLPSNAATFTGDLTYYSPGLGACGITSTSSQAICAVSHIIFDAASTSSNPNDNPLCGKQIRIRRYDDSVGAYRSADVTVVDRCVGCSATSLDLSLSVFEELANEALGRVTATWAWLP